MLDFSEHGFMIFACVKQLQILLTATEQTVHNKEFALGLSMQCSLGHLYFS